MKNLNVLNEYLNDTFAVQDYAVLQTSDYVDEICLIQDTHYSEWKCGKKCDVKPDLWAHTSQKQSLYEYVKNNGYSAQISRACIFVWNGSEIPSAIKKFLK